MASEETSADGAQEAEIGYISQQTYEDLSDRHLRTMWDIHEQWGTPETKGSPYRWTWDEVQESLYDVAEEMDFDDVPQGIRRSLALCAPGEGMTSETLSVFFQLVEAGEESGCHRHNVSAFRFVVQGDTEMRTVVEGEPFPMEFGDLVLTPNWTWHDHVNEADTDAIWIDVLDWPFVGGALKSPIFEDNEDYRQDWTKEEGHFNSQYGGMRPAGDAPKQYPDCPPYRFAWDDIRDTIRQTAAAEDDRAFDPANGYNLEYINPETGEAPVLASISLRMQLLEDDMDLDRHRHNSMEFYFVMEGEGRTEVGDEVFEWSERDSFVVPRGYWHEHEALSDEAILFVTSDRPIFDAFHLHRVETDDDAHLL